MRILLTNDDGFACMGITALKKRLQQEHEVWIVAPDKNRSGVSHRISMTQPLKLSKVSDNSYVYSGCPVDCVIAGLRGGILPVVPDVVLSGINMGANIGTDILYSGTTAAACQAVLYGFPGVALSVESEDGAWKYEAMADFAAKNLLNLMRLCVTAKTGGEMPETPCVYVNVNGGSTGKYNGVKMQGISFREYGDALMPYNAPDGNRYFFFKPGKIKSRAREISDFDAVKEGFISISRVFAEPVSAGAVDDVEFLM